MSDELKVSADSGGIELTSKGKATGRLVNAVCDLGSPFTEAAGFLGDYVRTYRAENAIKALHRVKQISAERDQVLLPPKPKFLVDWIESVSLEDDEELIELWANLFVEEGVDSKRSHYLFKRILREIGTSEARTLEKIATVGGRFQDIAQAEDAESICNSGPEFFRAFEFPEEFLDTRAWEDAVSHFIDNCQVAGIVVESVSCYGGENDEDFPLWFQSDHSHTLFDLQMYDSVDILRSLNLIELSKQSKRYTPRGFRFPVVLDISVYFVTPIGAKFLLTCRGKDHV